MKHTAVFISCSHVYRLKSGPFFAVKTVNSDAIQHIIFKYDEKCHGLQYSLAIETIYEFSELRNAVIKGISVLMATESTKICPVQGDIQNYFSCSDVDSSCLELYHAGQIFPADMISYEGVVSEVLFEGCLYSLDEGRLHLCTIHLATAAPILCQGDKVFVENAHILKNRKPYLLVCCGLSKVCRFGARHDPDELEISQIGHLVHKYGWNSASFERVLEVVNSLKDRLNPKFLNNEDFTRSPLNSSNSILEVLFRCCHLYPDIDSSDGSRMHHSPLKDFLVQPHQCCAINGTEEELLPGIKFVSIEETRLFLENQVYNDLPTWKFKKVLIDISFSKMILVGFLSSLPDGTPCLVDNSGIIPCSISYIPEACETGERDSCQVHHHFPPPRASYGQLVAVSRFHIVEENCKMTGESHNYLLLEEKNLIVLKTDYDENMEQQCFSGLGTSPVSVETHLNWYFLCQLIVPRTKIVQKNVHGLFQCFLDAVVISNSLVEVSFKEDCHTKPPFPNILLDEDYGPIDFLEQKRKRRFLLEDPTQVLQSSALLPGRPYLLEVPLSKEPDHASTLARRLAVASTLLLTPGTRISPFTRHISHLCFRHSEKGNNLRFRLLTEDCICPLARLTVTPISVICDENFFSDESVHIDCTIKEKWIIKGNKGVEGKVETSLLVLDWNSLEDASADPASNVYLNAFSNSSKLRGLLPGCRLLISALRRVCSQLGNVYLKSTQDTCIQHLSLKDDSTFEEILYQPMRNLSCLPLDYQWFDSLSTIIKIFSITIAIGNTDPDSTLASTLDIKATFLLDDGTDQAVATCKDNCVRDLLYLLDQDWDFLLFLARSSSQGLHFDQDARWRDGARGSAEDQLLAGLGLRAQVRRQAMLTCRQISHKFAGCTQGGATRRRRRVLCSAIRPIKPTDVILRLMHNLNS